MLYHVPTLHCIFLSCVLSIKLLIFYPQAAQRMLTFLCALIDKIWQQKALALALAALPHQRRSSMRKVVCFFVPAKTTLEAAEAKVSVRNDDLLLTSLNTSVLKSKQRKRVFERSMNRTPGSISYAAVFEWRHTTPSKFHQTASHTPVV